MAAMRTPRRAGSPITMIAFATSVALGLTAVPARAAIINVPGDQPTIQAALDAAVSGDEIVVAPGIYGESALTIAGKALTLRSSGGAGVTTIDSGGPQVFDLATAISNDLLLEGFTVTGNTGPEAAIELGDDSSLTMRFCTVTGNTSSTKPAGVDVQSDATFVAENCTFSGNVSTNGLGGAIRVTAGSTLLTDCMLTLNDAPGGFGGAIRLGGSGRLEVRNTTFDQNSALEGGAVSLAPTLGQGAALHQCIFTGNTATGDGGAVAIENTGFSMHLLNRCTFDDNSALAAGALLIAGQNHLVTDCTFVDNEAVELLIGVGGALAMDSSTNGTAIENCSFFGNTAVHGAALFDGGFSNLVKHCVFSGNVAEGRGGGIFCYDSFNSRIEQCSLTQNDGSTGGRGIDIDSGCTNTIVSSVIAWNNSGTDVLDIGMATTVQYSDLPNAGFGNINADPLFVDADGADDTPGTPDDDLRLQAGSPCIDAGFMTNLSCITAGPDGNERLFDEPGTSNSGSGGLDYLDMGAYEFGAPVAVVADCNGDLMEDACEPGYADCNSNLADDRCDIAGGGSLDYNLDGTPDECQTPPVGEVVWTNDNGGPFRRSSNWSPDTPGPLNTAAFDGNVPPYPVRFDQDVMIDRLVVRSDDVTFDLLGFTCDVLSTTSTSLVVGETNGDTGSWIVVNGIVTFDSGEFGRDAGASGDVVVTGATATLSASDITVGRAGAGTLTVEAGAQVTSVDGVVGEDPGSSGAVLITGPGSDWTLQFGIDVRNGSVTVEDGGLLDIGFTQALLFANGRLDGDGTVDGELVNLGEIDPTGGDRTLTVSDDYVQVGAAGPFSGSGKLLLDLGGTTPGTEHDVLDVTGQVTLGGGLFVDITVPFVPQTDDTFDVVLATMPVIDSFDVLFTTGLPAGKLLTIQQPMPVGPGSDNITLVVLDLNEAIGFDPPDEFGVSGLPSGAVLEDFDGDTYPDLAVAVPANDSVVILFNDSTTPNNWGGFNPVTQEIFVGTAPSDVAAGRLDANGSFDLAVTNAGDGTVSILTNNGSGSFTETQVVTVGTDPRALDIGDVDGGNGPDITVANFADDTVSVLINDGAGVYAQDLTPTVVGGGPADVAIGHFDIGVGLDFAVANQSDDNVMIFYNPGGTGIFITPGSIVPVGDGPGILDPADLDNDKDLDLVVGNRLEASVSVGLNNGDGTFAPPVDLPVGDNPNSITTVDMDQDGDEEIAVAVDDAVDGRVVRVLRNDLTAGQLGFSPDADLAQGDEPILVVSGDLDQDGIDDLVTVNDDTAPLPPGAAAATSGPPPGSVDVLLNVTDVLACPADCDLPRDQTVDVADLLKVLGDWGQPTSTCELDGSGFVDVGDLLQVLADWGACS